MADDLQTIIQRMIDAGEPEANIATVVQHFKSQPDVSGNVMRGQAAQAIAESRGGFPRPPSAPQSDAPVSDQPSLLTRVGQAIEPLAHPSSLADIGALLVPNSMGAGETALPSLARGMLRVLKAGGQEAGSGSYLGAPVRFIRGAVKSFQEAPQSVAEAQIANYNKLPLASQEANRPAAPWDTSLKWEQDLPKGPAQAVYVQLPDGSYGLKAAPGHVLTEGARVNATNRAGGGTMHTVGPMTPEGIAPIASHDAPPALPLDLSNYPEAYRAKIIEKLQQQGVR